MGELANRRALVTGGTGGIGMAVARCLAEAGASVMVSDLNAEACKMVTDTLKAEGLEADHRTLDVTSRDEVEAIFAELSATGGIDILVTSAAIAKASPILDVTAEDWERILAVNLTGAFHCCQCAGQQMIERGYGRIVNMSSVNGQIANSHRGAYSCTKGGLDMLTKLLAAELGPFGVTANAVAPAPVDTLMIKDLHGPQDRQRWYDQLPIKRYAKPEEVAEAVRFLCSDSAAYINGHILNVDGGFMASGILLEPVRSRR